MADELNNFFLSVVDRLNIKTNKPKHFDSLEYGRVFYPNISLKSMFLDPILPEDVISAIKSLKNGKSPGIDNINSVLLKNVYPKILDVLVHLINLSFGHGIFPSKLKDAVVIPLYKSGSKLDCSNFRPISLLSTFAKIYEKIMKKKLVRFLENNKFFSHNQFGFREGKNTEFALQQFMERVYNGLNAGKKVTGIFLDIKKAFDTVDHKILLNKLHNCGVRGNVHAWFESYLTNRRQCVKINHTYSKMGYIKYGVTQGSVLGAILFLVYINDLCNGNFIGNLTSFADDTALSYVKNNWAEVKHDIQQDLDALQWWFTMNHMLLSPEKTKYITFNLRSGAVLQDVILYKCIACLCQHTQCNNCAVVSQTDSIKYLGVILDKEINWKKHIQSLKSKLNNVLRYFYFLKDICNQKLLRSLYFSLVHSRLEYGIFCWGGTFEVHLNSIFVQQKKFLKIITKTGRREPSYPLFLEQRILPLKYTFVLKVLKLYYILSGNLPEKSNIKIN